MIEFFAQYGGSFIVGLIVLILVALVIVKMVKDKRSGKSSCGGDCAHCGACRYHNNVSPNKKS